MRINLTWIACVLAAAGPVRAQTATESVILSFANFPHGANPYAPLLAGSGGALYGTASAGGQSDLGVVFELAGGSYKVLHSFKGGSDGAKPYAGVAQDAAGNLYGTTYQGGAANAGVVYKLTPSGQETVLYSFTGGADGGNPYAGLIVDSTGNLYGTTSAGGSTNCIGGCGVVYKVSAAGQQTVLYSFAGTPDGANPYAGVIADSSGNLYGTTYAGGVSSAGTVYQLSRSGQETVLHSFGGPGGGASPYAGVIRDSVGNLYGTTSLGGGLIYELQAGGSFTVLYTFPYPAHRQTPTRPESGLVRDPAGNLYGTTQLGGTAGVGAVYMLSPAGTLSTLYSFPGGGLSPGGPVSFNAGLIRDSSGNLYGTTPYASAGGMVYKLSASGQGTTLFNFTGAPGGTAPVAGLTRDRAGNLYGTTSLGGAANAGVVYKVDTTGHETVLYSFTGGADGDYPLAGVTLDSAGNLYGTTFHGGTQGFGVVYKIDTAGQESVLYSFTGGADGGYPEAGVILDPGGNLYGTTFVGGVEGAGVVFELDAAGQETVLYSFTGGADGGYPLAGLISDAAGNFYGTTNGGGTAGLGVVYKLSAAGQETVLYSFPGGPDGALPSAGVIRDAAGNLYGTTADGGGPAGEGGHGVVFELTAAGGYSVLYTFTGGPDGGAPLAGVIRDLSGNLYGTASNGGTAGCSLGCGVVYKVDTGGQETVLYSFSGGADGANPYAGLAADSAGNLYGTTPWGGKGGADGVISSGTGVVYRVRLK
jgi:uncharacterized repeat protein (TIGR03803 family)